MFTTLLSTICQPLLTARHPELAGRQAQALGVSLVIHPTNPNVPNQSCQRAHVYRGKKVAEPTVVWWGRLLIDAVLSRDGRLLHWHQMSVICARHLGGRLSQV